VKQHGECRTRSRSRRARLIGRSAPLLVLAAIPEVWRSAGVHCRDCRAVCSSARQKLCGAARPKRCFLRRPQTLRRASSCARALPRRAHFPSRAKSSTFQTISRNRHPPLPPLRAIETSRPPTGSEPTGQLAATHGHQISFPTDKWLRHQTFAPRVGASRLSSCACWRPGSRCMVQFTFVDARPSSAVPARRAPDARRWPALLTAAPTITLVGNESAEQGKGRDWATSWNLRRIPSLSAAMRSGA
jgi:hypothetical protein